MSRTAFTDFTHSLVLGDALLPVTVTQKHKPFFNLQKVTLDHKTFYFIFKDSIFLMLLKVDQNKMSCIPSLSCLSVLL